jgi:hypothetical protein
MYEIFNEPGDSITWNDWKVNAQALVDQVRKYDNKTMMLIGGPGWSSDLSGVVGNPVRGSNLAYVIHAYPTWNQKYTDAKRCQNPSQYPSPCWDAHFGNTSSVYPVFATEWGFYSSDNASPDVVQGQNCARATYAAYWNGYETALTNYLQSKGISWSAFVWDSDTCLGLLSSWINYPPTPHYGQYVRGVLTQLTLPPIYTKA